MLAMQAAASAASLTHRYSFSETDGSTNGIVADSVGGASWNGTIPNGGTFPGDGTLALQLSSSQYVNFPPNMLTNLTSVTIDMWAQFYSPLGNCFAFAFGATDSSGAGGYCIFFQPRDGRLAISGGTPSWQFGEENANGAGNLAPDDLQPPVHITAVINPPLGYEAIYTNGVLAGVNLAETVPLSSVSGSLAYIARSLYDADAYINMQVNEYRVWDSALNPLEVGGENLSGPDTVSTDYGTVTDLSMTLQSPISVGGGTTPTITVTASGLPNPITVQTPDLGITYTSSNTNVVSVNPTNGAVLGVAAGTADIVADLGGISDTQSVTVIAVPTAMIHRYSFDETTTNDMVVVHDSVGSADGTFHNADGMSSIEGGAVKLSGTSKDDYVSLGSNLVTSASILNGAATLEAWVTVYPGNGIWTRIWDFGDFQSGGTIGSSAGQNYWSFMPTISPADNNVSRMELALGGNLDLNYSGHGFQGWTNVHIAAVFNPSPARQFAGLYINGNLVQSASTGARTFSQLGGQHSWLGRSLWSGDSALAGEINEFRIYGGELDRFQVAASYQAGPDSTNSSVGTFTSMGLNLGGSQIYAGQLRQGACIINFTSPTNVSLLGDANLSFSSSNTNVAYVDANGVVRSGSPGTATVTATYNYVVGVTTNTYSTNATITVVNPSPTLVHRYSFSETTGTTVSDSVGGADGEILSAATGTLNYSWSAGQLTINTDTNLAGDTYVALQNGVGNLVSALTNGATFEIWITDAGSGFWARIWDFGSLAGPPNLFLATHTDQPYVDWSSGNLSTPATNAVGDGILTHIVLVYDDPENSASLYVNNIKVRTTASAGLDLSTLGDINDWLGRSEYSADPYYTGSFNEFRIYSGVMSAAQVASHYLAGPDNLNPVSLSVGKMGSNLLLSWPTSAAGFSVQSSTSLSGGWGPAGGTTNLVGDTWQLSVPITGNAQYFRLSK